MIVSIAVDAIKSRCHPSCRTCAAECLLLHKLDVNGVGLAELKAVSTDFSIPFSCNACDLCAAICTRRLNPGEVMRAWRAEVAGSDSGLPPALGPRLADQPENLYAAYRRAYPGDVGLPEPSPAETVFFPGCALSAYTPDLALAVFDSLHKRFPRLGWLDGCCDDVLDRLGLEPRYALAQQALAAKVAKRGVRCIVTACPSCHHRLAQSFPELQVISIYQNQADERRKVNGLPGRVAVHDSCADRFRQELGPAVRGLLPETQKLKHEGKRSLCCGAGGGVNFTNPELADEITHRRWAEVEASGAELLVTYCIRCAVQLSQFGPDNQVVHILDLIYAREPDYGQIVARLRGLS
jgi:Fe-S oxidoreductase